MKKIVKIDLSPKVYGGRIYENEVISQLEREVVFKKVFLIKYSFKVLNIPRILYIFLKYRYFFKGDLFLNDRTTFLAGKKAKNYIIIHHVDASYSPKLSIIFQKFSLFWLRKNKNLFYKVITVSNYWKDYLAANYQFKIIKVIYNSFNLNDYVISDFEKKEFIEKYGLLNKPIIYIGNAQEKKGVRETFEEIKKIDAYIVTSGRPQIELNCLNLNLNHREYIILLSVANVVITMSKFLEGWNRTAHEAILLKTPVIGSGKGGMKELLDKSGQYVVTDFEKLNEAVLSVLNSKRKSFEISEFILGLNLIYFKSAWTTIFKNKKNG